jgi:serine/threonine protein kinase
MADHVGKQLGNYHLIRLIGQGGFADVYLGEHIHLNTQAAIKVLQARLGGGNLEQFRHEARTIASLVHPHIIRVLDFGLDENIPFLVMDYAPNGTLRHHHPKGTLLPPVVVVSYVTQIASALQYAHDRKLIHRDIKPENLLLGRNNDVLLSDFGLVSIAQSSESQEREMGGTVPYMAPEQLQGKARMASDQYSLGIIVYEWLSGDRPFRGSFMEIASQHVLAPPPPLFGSVPGISLALEEVVMTALAKDPKQRYPSIQAFATALEKVCSTELGGSDRLLGVSPSDEQIAPGEEGPSQYSSPESIFWTRRADAMEHPSSSDSLTIHQEAQINTSDRRRVELVHTPLHIPAGMGFQFNQPLVEPGEFYGRTRQRATLLNRLRNGASTSVVGPRRVGKTWLMSYVRLVAQSELGSRFLIGYVDATAARSATVIGFTSHVLEVFELQRRSLDDAAEGLALLEEGVQRLVSRNHVPILFIDEFEGFGDRQIFDLHFFTSLRAMTQIGLCLIVASRIPLIEFVGDYGKTSGFFNVFEQLRVQPFSRKEAERFVEAKGSQAGLTDQERKRLLHFGNLNGEYWPIRLQLVGKMLLEDKLLSIQENDQDYYRPNDLQYWQDFERRLEETYRGVVR